MHCPNHRDYYLARAATSRSQAARAVDPKIAAIHAEFATRYEQLAGHPDPAARAPLTLVQAA